MLLLAAASTEIPGADITVPGWATPAFLAGVAALLLIDLYLFHREAHEPSMREAAVTSAIWVSIGLAFGVVLWLTLGGAAASQYLTGYVIEQSLSVDNVFVWAVIFGYFTVPRQYQHRVLFWGIFGALVLRAIFIVAGVALLERFEPVTYVFGAFLVYTAWRVARHEDEDINPEHSPVLKLARRFLPVTRDYHGQSLFVLHAGRRMATPLFLVLLVVEASDVVFAVDSVPAILAVTRSEFLVYTSNALAILGLRALYFLLAGASDRLVHLNQGLGVILAFVGAKMLLAQVVHIPTSLSLAVIAVVLGITVATSLHAERNMASTGAPSEDA